MKNTFLKYLFLLLSTLFLVACSKAQPQEAIYSRLQTAYNDDNLKGPVKEIVVITKTPYKDTVSDKERYLNYYGALFDWRGGGGYTYYTKDGLRLIRVYRNVDSITQSLDDFKKDRNYNIYNYDTLSLKKVLQHKTPYKISPLAYNPYWLRVTHGSADAIELKDKPEGYISRWYLCFEYEFDPQDSSKVLKELTYQCQSKKEDGKEEERELKYVANYIYDEKGRLIRKEFDLSPIIKTYENRIDTPPSYLPLEGYGKWFISLDPYRKYNWQDFKYDDKGRLVFYGLRTGTDEFMDVYSARETYHYHPDGWIEKIERVWHDKGITSYETNHTARRMLYYNERGELIKKENLDFDNDTVKRTFLFRYSGHDQWGNWTRFNTYLNGKIEPKPHIYKDRRLEYYKEEQHKE